MTFDINRYLNRPKSWQYLLAKADGAKATLSRAVQNDKITRTSINVYSKRGWFAALGDNWTPHDAVMQLVIVFNHWLSDPMVRNASDPESLRRLASQLTRGQQQIQNYVDELNRRADKLELEEREKEEPIETD